MKLIYNTLLFILYVSTLMSLTSCDVHHWPHDGRSDLDHTLTLTFETDAFDHYQTVTLSPSEKSRASDELPYHNLRYIIRYYLNLQGIFNQNDKITFLDFQDWNKKANFVSGQKKRRLRDKADAILRGGYVVPSFCPLLSFWGTKEAPASRISDLDACVGIHL